MDFDLRYCSDIIFTLKLNRKCRCFILFSFFLLDGSSFFFFHDGEKKKKNQCIYLPKNCCFNRFSLNLISAVFMTLEMFFSASLSEEKII